MQVRKYSKIIIWIEENCIIIVDIFWIFKFYEHISNILNWYILLNPEYIDFKARAKFSWSNEPLYYILYRLCWNKSWHSSCEKIILNRWNFVGFLKVQNAIMIKICQELKVPKKLNHMEPYLPWPALTFWNTSKLDQLLMQCVSMK